jgi:hypothetical protein
MQYPCPKWVASNIYPSDDLANTSSSRKEALDTVRPLDRVCSLGVNLRFELLAKGCHNFTRLLQDTPHATNIPHY